MFIWLRIDYKLGRKKHLEVVNKREYPLRKGDVALFTYGEDLFKDLFNEIRAAKQHIHVLFYIVRDDKISNEFLQLLMDKAEEGVEVRLIVDKIGGNKMSQNNIDALKKSGVQFHFCHKPKFPFIFFTLNSRNHRKITVIDGKIGYVGGYNVGKEYLGRDPKLGYWRDYHLKVIGRPVYDLQTQFLYDFHDITNLDLLGDTNYYPPLPDGPIPMKMVPTDGAYLENHFIELINQAEDELIIGSPYFIPGKRIADAFIQVARRGVKVKILIPRVADHPFVKEAAYPYFRPLMKEGIEFYFYEKGFYHAKVFIVDDKVCDIGTANVHKRSFYLNHEINCYIFDKTFINQVKGEIRKDMANATQLTEEELNNRSWFHRGKEKVSTLISDFL